MKSGSSNCDVDDGVVWLYWMVVDEAKSDAGRLARRRGSDLGRNLKGVWKTEGADAGGLKTMWFPPGFCCGSRKDGCGGMLRARFVRDRVDCLRAPAAVVGMRTGRSNTRLLRDEAEERMRCWQQLAAVLLVSWASMAAASKI